MAYSDFDDDILASNLVLVSSFTNQKRKLSLRAQKEENVRTIISEFVHSVCEEWS